MRTTGNRGCGDWKLGIFCGGTVMHSVELFAEEVSWRSLNNPDWCEDRRSLSDIGTSLPRTIFTENAK